MRKPFNGEFSITQRFGNNPAYYSQFGFAGHEGVDYGCPTGTQILACAKDTVVRRNDVKDGAYGIYIVLWHKELNLATWYCHLQEVKTVMGQEVNEGDIIAISDNTGNTSGPHLHLNLCRTDSGGTRINTDNGYKGFVDPLPFLDVPSQTDSQIIQWSDNWLGLVQKFEFQNNKDIVYTEIEQLIKLQDAIVAKDRELAEKNTELLNLKKEITQLTDDNKVLSSQIDQTQRDVDAIGERLKIANNKITELMNVKPITEYSRWELFIKALFGRM